MREAVGGTLLMYIVIIFLFVYIGFMATVINYGRVFRAKNTLISYIEAEEGFKSGGKTSFIQKANELGYTKDLYVCYTKGSSDTTTYFAVKLYITFEIPLLTAEIKIPITGETSGIRNVTGNTNEINECSSGSSKFNSSHLIRAGS